MPEERALDERMDLTDAAGILEEFAGEELGETADAETEKDREEPEESTEETEELESESEDLEAGDDETEEEEAEEEPGEHLYTVTIDGTPQQVTLQEALAGYQRQSDYTRKTQSLADERRKAESEATDYRQTREQYSQRLELLAKALESDTSEPDWAKVREEQPDDYPRLYADYARRKAESDKVERERERVREEQQKDTRKDYERHIAVERDKLVAAIPEWSNPETANTEREAMVEHARTIGFTPEEIGAAADHRALLLLRDSMLYRRLLAEGKGVRVKKDKVLKPGTKVRKSKKTVVEQAHDQLRKTGRPQDAERVFFEMLGEEEK